MKNTKFLTRFLAFILTMLVVDLDSALAQAEKPNIVFILTDNLGYGEVGAYGGGVTRGAPTPRIDSLAKEGTRLLNMNMETQCTPSRSSLMTGRWAIRSGTHSVPWVYNLYRDPREEQPMVDSWVIGPALKIVGKFEQSVEQYPLIPMDTPDPYVPAKKK